MNWSIKTWMLRRIKKKRRKKEVGDDDDEIFKQWDEIE